MIKKVKLKFTVAMLTVPIFMGGFLLFVSMVHAQAATTPAAPAATAPAATAPAAGTATTGSSSVAGGMTIQPLYQVLGEGTGAADTTNNIKKVWGNVRDLINAVVIAVLIFVAFANILRIQINNYAVKKFLPTLILAVILANFSYFICRAMVDLANVAIDLLMKGATTGTGVTSGTAGGISTTQTGVAGAFDFTGKAYTVDPNNLNRSFIMILAEFVGAVFILILSFLFFIRNYIIYFLVALSPLAFMSMILPLSKSVFNQWWSQFLRWTFMPIVSVFWLWLGGMWYMSGFTGGESMGKLKSAADGAAAVSSTDFNSAILALAFAAVCYYLAITTPFKMGGAIMQKWGDLGKKAWGATAGAELKRQGKMWWSKQAASENQLNVLGHIARTPLMWNRRSKFFEDKTNDNYNDKAMASLARSRRGARYEVETGKLGGEYDKAKKEGLDAYQQTDEGKEWMKNRQKWLDEVAQLDQKTTLNYGKAAADFRESSDGLALAAERLRLAQEAFVHEDRVNSVEKTILIDFLRGKGQFAENGRRKAADLELLNNRMMSKTRNLRLDEMVKKSEQDEVDKIYQDQMHLSNIKGEIQARLKTIRDPNTNQATRNILQQEIGELETSALNFYNNRTSDPALGAVNGIGGAPHIAGMIDENANIGEKVKGFAGLPDSDDDLDTIMMTRTGKLLSMEIKGDVEKYKDEKTVDEIADDLGVNSTIKTKINKLADGSEVDHMEVLENFREGRRHLNDPAANREIEGRLLTLALVAKQTSNADAPAAARRLATMMSDQATEGAIEAFNNAIQNAARTKTNPAVYIASNAIQPNVSMADARLLLESHMSQGSQIGRMAFSAVTRQRSMGVSLNSSSYLSTDDDVSGYRQTPQSVLPTVSDAISASKAVVSAMAKANKDSYSSLSRELAESLGEPIEKLARYSKEINDHMRWQRVNLARDFAKQIGITLPSSLRPAFIDAIAKLPRDASPAQVTEAVRTVDPNLSPRITNNMSIAVTQPGGGSATLGLQDIITKANNIQMGEAGAKMLGATQHVEDHLPYLQHFENISREQAKAHSEMLSQARSALENNRSSTEAIASAERALKATGFAVAGNLQTDGVKIGDQLIMAHNASQAASNAYDQGGKFDIHHAVDNLVKDANPESYHRGLENRRRKVT